MKVFANLRPAVGFTELADAVPLKERVIEGVDLLLVREANGGLYVAEPRGIEKLDGGRERGVNTMAYTTEEVKRVARVAFRLAAGRSGRLCSVDKANVLEVSTVWRNAVVAVHRDEFPEIALSHMFVDNCAMQLVRDPRQFDVLVTDNIFGDILSDGSAAIMGSLGMAPSGALNDPEADGRRRGLYEPVHGSAPDIAGKGIANPIGAIWSLALALRHSFDRPDDAELIVRAVREALGKGVRTPDIAGEHVPVGTVAMADAILAELDRLN
jgi:3-isopropylmalate dehydrogenase